MKRKEEEIQKKKSEGYCADACKFYTSVDLSRRGAPVCIIASKHGVFNTHRGWMERVWLRGN